MARGMTGRRDGPRDGAWANMLFVLPFVIAYAALLLYPLGYGLWMSLNDYDLLGGDTVWVGWKNFVDLWNDPIFIGTVRNTLLFVLMTVPAFVALGIVLALALNRRTRLAAVLRSIFFGTSVLSVTVTTLIWRMVLLPHTGGVASALSLFGISGPALLTNASTALPAIAGVTVWWSIGLPMMLVLASLQQIPDDIYEAARLDRAGWWRTLARITLPSIKRTLIVVVVIEIILQFQLFGQAQLMTQGGPNNASRPIVQFVYESGFRDWRLGYAAAAAQVLFVFMLATAGLQFWLGRRRAGEP